ncbi:MAG: ABC transporter transmembrane domain-containing protein [Verrucomicrobiota bacterium]
MGRKDIVVDDAYGTFIRLLGFARPYRFRLIVGTVFGAVFAGSNTGIPVALKKVFGSVFNPDTATFSQVLLVALLLPVISLCRGIGNYFSTYFVEWVGHKVVMDLRVKAYEHVQNLSVNFFSKAQSGDLMTRISSDTQLVERAVSVVVGDLVKQPFTLIGATCVLFWLDWKLAILSVVVFPVCIVPVRLFGRRVRKFSKESQVKLGEIMSYMQEAIVGVRIVKAFGMEKFEIERFTENCRKVFRMMIRVTKARAAIDPVITTISAVGISLVLMYSYMTKMPSEDFFAFVVALLLLYDPVKKISKLHLNLQRSSASAERIFEIIDTPITVTDRPDAVAFDEEVRTITFEDVGFAYKPGEPLLEQVDMDIQAGQCFAFVGETGSGKTTLVSMVLRFFDATRGRVAINGRDVRDFTIESLRRQISLVSQDTILFNDTIANNIAYGEGDVSREQIEEAARKAHAHSFIMKKTEGYDTVIGERGLGLSGGERQRLAIARAILRNPPILILDEATSALDTESERHVQAAIDELMKGRTVLAIAHRLSTIAHADQILVLKKGRIIERGTHQELLDLEGTYKRLHDLQFNG